MLLFYCCVVAIIISAIIKLFVDIDRPETAVAASGKLILESIPEKSFPSDHTSVGVAFLIGLYYV